MPKLNPNEAPEGYVAAVCKKGPACDKCHMSGSEECFTVGLEMCFPERRIDKCGGVYFKRKPTKPIRKPREWMAWTCVPSGPEFLPYVFKSRVQARYNSGGRQVIRVKITEVV